MSHGSIGLIGAGAWYWYDYHTKAQAAKDRSQDPKLLI